MTHYDHDALIAAGAAALPALLRLFWVLAAGAVTVTVLPVPRVPQAFKDAVRLSAARGKLWDAKPAALGPLRDWAVPQRWFLHFYLVGIAATAATLGAFGCALGHAAAHDSSSSGSSGGARMIDAEAALSLLGLALFLVHVTRRAAETALLMRYPPDAAMHGIAYVFGLSYYAVAPLSLVPERWFAAALPAALGLGSGGSGSGGAPCTVSTVTSGAAAAAVRSGGPVIVALAVVGAAVFLAGNALQLASHAALAALGGGGGKAGSGKAGSGKAAYQIPRGPLFAHVSCPHYLAEIVIYAGLAVATGGRLNALLMLAWVAVNLVLAAGATQAWYLKRFGARYPRGRRALVPFVY